MNCLIRIRQRYAGFAQSDKKLADFLLSQPDHARHLSSQQLASEAGVSQSSVVKFAQKIGFKGFPALKLAISEALVNNPNPQSMPVHNQIRGDDPMRLVGEKLIKENVAAMHATLDVNTEEKLLESVAMLRTARRIILTGIGASGLVARNFGWKLTKIGYNAIVEQDMHALLATVQAMDPGDLLLAISYSGERREINMATDEALRVGGKILAITGFTPNSLQQRATRCLYTIAEEQATRSAAISSTSAQMMLTDLLFMALVQQDLERAESLREKVGAHMALAVYCYQREKWQQAQMHLEFVLGNANKLHVRTQAEELLCKLPSAFLQESGKESCLFREASPQKGASYDHFRESRLFEGPGRGPESGRGQVQGGQTHLRHDRDPGGDRSGICGSAGNDSGSGYVE